MVKIKKNDTVFVLSGKSKGKTGKVLAVIPVKNRAIVEGVNMIKKHARRTRDDQQGGIVHREASINISNLAIFCKGCNRPAKVGFSKLNDGTKNRFVKNVKRYCK